MAEEQDRRTTWSGETVWIEIAKDGRAGLAMEMVVLLLLLTKLLLLPMVVDSGCDDVDVVGVTVSEGLGKEDAKSNIQLYLPMYLLVVLTWLCSVR